jgi:hypothetical protein
VTQRHSFSAAVELKQAACDHVSFFIGNKTHDELQPVEIAQHTCLHLHNVLEKISAGIDGDAAASATEVVREEVVPDLMIYGVQIATAFRADWLMGLDETYVADQSGHEPPIRSMNDLIRLQAERDGVMNRIFAAICASARREIIRASSTLARICDKHAHGVALATDHVHRDVSGVFVREALRMAHASGVDLDEAYSRRIEQTKSKFGNVRVLLGKE